MYCSHHHLLLPSIFIIHHPSQFTVITTHCYPLFSSLTPRHNSVITTHCYLVYSPIIIFIIITIYFYLPFSSPSSVSVLQFHHRHHHSLQSQLITVIHIHHPSLSSPVTTVIITTHRYHSSLLPATPLLSTVITIPQVLLRPVRLTHSRTPPTPTHVFQWTKVQVQRRCYTTIHIEPLLFFYRTLAEITLVCYNHGVTQG